MPRRVTLTATLRAEYDDLFRTCVVRESRQGDVEILTTRLIDARGRYDRVAAEAGVPWHVIAAIHCLETSIDFTRHLHNGDPLTARTTHVPSGRPASGEPPFTWEVSAADALALKKLSADTDWSLAGTLFQLERYNGFGYRLRHPDVLSPYLWSFSHHYKAGKFVSDGKFSATAVSRQCGAAVLLRRLAERGVVTFADQPAPSAMPLVMFSETLPADPDAAERVRELQRFLNTFPGVFVKVDGVAGPKTSDAHRVATGHFLAGDPRAVNGEP
jgi:lysozyme family protein